MMSSLQSKPVSPLVAAGAVIAVIVIVVIIFMVSGINKPTGPHVITPPAGRNAPGASP